MSAKWTYWIIQDLTLVDAFHPMHLHGHDFFILAQGEGIFDPLFVSLNLVNPPRRDTATLFGNGYLVIAVYTDNPGYVTILSIAFRAMPPADDITWRKTSANSVSDRGFCIAISRGMQVRG